MCIRDSITDLPKITQFLSKIELHNKNSAAAFTLAEKSLSISKDHDFVKEEFNSYLLLSHLHTSQGQHEKSILYANKVFKHATEKEDFELLYQSADKLANSYHITGDHEKSYHFRTEHQKAKDQYVNSQNIIAITGKTTKYLSLIHI